MLGPYLLTITMVDVTLSRLESCFVFQEVRAMPLSMTGYVVRKFTYKLIDLINSFLVLMELPSKRNHHQSSLIMMSWCLDLTETHHL